MIEGYTKLCRFDELKEGTGKRFIVDETEVAVLKSIMRYVLSAISVHISIPR